MSADRGFTHPHRLHVDGFATWRREPDAICFRPARSRCKACDATGLVDSGASVNVLPFRLGCELGLDWDQQTTPIQLSGNLADRDARSVLLAVDIVNLPPVDLVFAWSQRNGVPLIFGQTNFFMQFDVCFFRTRGFFTVSPHDDG
ncbi:hypothetical protein [Novipirellula aureliae]|uniref:hypothetical protein n=1 Tax=Novipirellula aureliae TaxID=2527966 RepID=UPI0018CE8782|nr:hypothetical protein [Novipirellula aureliae]